MNKRAKSSEPSSSTSFSSNSTIGTRHRYSSHNRAPESSPAVHNIVVNSASSHSTVENQKPSITRRDLVTPRRHHSVVYDSPLFGPDDSPEADKKKDSDLDSDLITSSSSPARNAARAGSISDDEDFVNPAQESYPPFSHRKGKSAFVSEAEPKNADLPYAFSPQPERTRTSIPRPATPAMSVRVGLDSRPQSYQTGRPLSSSTVPDVPYAARETSTLSDTTSQTSHSAHNYLRSLAESARSRVRSLEKEEAIASADINSIASHGVSIPAVSDSYIDRNKYVMKPRWGLSTDDLVEPNKETNTTKEAEPPTEESERKTMSQSKSPMNEDLFTLDTSKDSTAAEFVANTIGPQMDSLSMEKVFNDPSFHRVYEQYSKTKRRILPTMTQSEPGQMGKPKNGQEVAGIEFAKMMKQPNAQLRNAIRDQLPAQLAILDADILTLLTEDVLKQSPLLQKLQDVCFRKRTDGTVECISIMDLGLEKKDHEFLTNSWGILAKMCESCRQVYEIVEESGCADSKFLRNIMNFMQHSVNQGLELATLLIRTATFVVIRDGQPADLLNYVHEMRQLTEAATSDCDFIETIRNSLDDNFSVIPVIASSMTLFGNENENVSRTRLRMPHSDQILAAL